MTARCAALLATLTGIGLLVLTVARADRPRRPTPPRPPLRLVRRDALELGILDDLRRAGR